ncbi:hypothetical protein B0J14DRAFT_705156 [Halenospora varia]|nr:hypothetical protein B0J14DRAFT_705156 [Halenospora varia]
MNKLRSSLEAHKSALDIALDMVSLTIARDIKANTEEIRNDTAAIKDDTTQILAEIARLQARLPEGGRVQDSNGFALQRYLDNLTSYAESSWDMSDAGSDNGFETKIPSDQNRSSSDRRSRSVSSGALERDQHDSMALDEVGGTALPFTVSLSSSRGRLGLDTSPQITSPTSHDDMEPEIGGDLDGGGADSRTTAAATLQQTQFRPIPKKKRFTTRKQVSNPAVVDANIPSRADSRTTAAATLQQTQFRPIPKKKRFTTRKQVSNPAVIYTSSPSPRSKPIPRDPAPFTRRKPLEWAGSSSELEYEGHQHQQERTAYPRGVHQKSSRKFTEEYEQDLNYPNRSKNSSRTARKLMDIFRRNLRE